VRPPSKSSTYNTCSLRTGLSVGRPAEFGREPSLSCSALHPLFPHPSCGRDTARGSIGTGRLHADRRIGYWGEEIGQSERSEWCHFGPNSFFVRGAPTKLRALSRSRHKSSSADRGVSGYGMPEVSRTSIIGSFSRPRHSLGRNSCRRNNLDIQRDLHLFVNAPEALRSWHSFLP
jgi:hypothetical protein